MNKPAIVVSPYVANDIAYAMDMDRFRRDFNMKPLEDWCLVNGQFRNPWSFLQEFDRWFEWELLKAEGMEAGRIASRQGRTFEDMKAFETPKIHTRGLWREGWFA